MLPHDEHNLRLTQLVHPANWPNPQPASRYNLVVIGAGTAGLVAAAGAAGLGARVALIERDLMGGDCLNVGCVPSKALISAARSAASVVHAQEFGLRLGLDEHNTAYDFPYVMERLRRLRAEIAPNDSAERFRGLGVDVFFGEGRFSGSDSIEVNGQILRFKRAVIATGARATRPSTPGLLEAGYLTNETIFSLTELPRRLAVIGGGPIGCELAQAFSRLGSQVTLIERSQQLLGREDEDAARIVSEALARDGVDVMLETQVERVERRGSVSLQSPDASIGNSRSIGGKCLIVRRGAESIEIVVDEILVGAGRVPNVEDLNLDAANVRYDLANGVTVNDRLQTSNNRIYAAGDICSRYKFTHAADFMARIVIQNALFFGRAKASTLTIPWCTYTSPEIAHVGLTEREANDCGIEVKAFVQDFRHIDRAILEGTTEGFVKIVTRAGTDRILGATIVADHAGEMIGEIVLAMTNNIGLKRLAGVIHPYPTVAEAIRKCGDTYNKTRLTPLVKSLFERWLVWTR